MLLFATPAATVTRRYTDPGDQPRRRNQSHRATSPPRAPKHLQPKPFKPNPFREKIASPDESEFRHMRWQGLRTRVQEVLATCGTSPHAMSRFANCGAECLVEWSETLQKYRLRASYCRCRHCAPCAKAKSILIARNLRTKLEAGAAADGDRFRFVTLTLKHSNEPLRVQIDDLYRHFRVLRRSKLWRRTQRGGAVLFECKLNERNEWHPHLHIISEGDFLPQDKLATEWMRLTNGSFRVDVRRIKGHKDAANYVAKYVGKGADASVWQHTDRAQEWVMATKGLRSCATFGSWRGFALLHYDPAQSATDWKPVGLLERICAQARAGSIADSNLLWLLADALQYDPAGSSRRNRDTTGST